MTDESNDDSKTFTKFFERLELDRIDAERKKRLRELEIIANRERWAVFGVRNHKFVGEDGETLVRDATKAKLCMY